MRRGNGACGSYRTAASHQRTGPDPAFGRQLKVRQRQARGWGQPRQGGHHLHLQGRGLPAVVVAAIGGVRQDLLGTQLPGLSAGKGRQQGPAVTPGGRGQRFLGTIARRQFRLQAGLELAVPMFEIDQEAVDTSGQDSQAAQPAHVGPEVHRIQALRVVSTAKTRAGLWVAC